MTRNRLLFYGGVLSTTAAVVIAIMPAGSQTAVDAYLPPFDVASLAAGPNVNVAAVKPTDPAVIPVAARWVTGGRQSILSRVSTEPPKLPAAAPAFEPGAKVKLLVYERSPDAMVEKYGKNGLTEDDFQQRTEMSGTFQIGPDDTLSVPLLGNFSVAGSTQQQLEAAIAAAFQLKMKRPGFATVIDITRPPVLILGPVKSPGKVEYTPGMTVLHAIALAGGIKGGMGGGDEPWERMETIRERISHASAKQDLADLYAQRAVLEAERDGVAPQVPPGLSTLVGPTKATAMIAIEQQRRHAIVTARLEQERAIDDQLQAARQNVTALRAINLNTYDAAITLAQRRVEAMAGFASKGTINNVQLLNVQAELENAKGRKAEVLQRLNEAQQNIGRLENEKAVLVKTTRSDISTALAGVRAQITSTEDKRVTSESLLRAMGDTGMMNVAYEADTGADSSTPHWSYHIVRAGPNGPVESVATDLTVLSPGDLVKVVLGTGKTPASSSQPGIMVPQQDPTKVKAVPAAVEKEAAK